MAELVYPVPVKRCKDKVTGKMLELYYHWDNPDFTDGADDTFFAMKVNEELAEVLAEKKSFDLQKKPEGDYEDYFNRAQKEIVDIITVCHSWLYNVYGLDDEDISELIAESNAKNKARGYLDV